MKGRVDKSMGIVTRIVEALTRIKPNEPLRLANREARKKRNCPDSSGTSPAKILASRCACKKSIRGESSSDIHSEPPK
jgi:phosphatidylserine/phosphatidylglycerophosphate/cardiolipin synthase-like enzyme